MNFYKEFIKKRFVLFVISMAVWLASVLAGIYYVSVAGSGSTEDTRDYIQSILNADSAFTEILKNGIGANFSFTVFMCISATLIILIPLTLFLIAFKGFSAGYTSAFIIKLYHLKGASVSLGAIVLPLAAMLPGLFMMFIMTMEVNILNFRSSSAFDERLKNYSSYCVKMLLIFCYLMIISLAEAFVSPWIFDFLKK